jgi:hypothetical protein
LNRVDVVENKHVLDQRRANHDQGAHQGPEACRELRKIDRETADHTANLEIQQLAQRIEHIALQLGENRAGPAHSAT